MNIDKHKIHTYIQAYGDTLKDLNIPVSEQDKTNICQLIVLLGEFDDLYDKPTQSFSDRDLQQIKDEMIALIPESPLKQRTLDALFEAMANEASSQHHGSLEQYLETSSITSGVQLVACYLGSLLKLSPEIWFSRRVHAFGHEIGSIVRLANDYLDLDTSQHRSLAEASQENSILFFDHKFALKLFIAYKYILHKLHYYAYIVKLKYLKSIQDWQHHLQAINCYESVLELGFKAYFVDQEACRD